MFPFEMPVSIEASNSRGADTIGFMASRLPNSITELRFDGEKKKLVSDAGADARGYDIGVFDPTTHSIVVAYDAKGPKRLTPNEWEAVLRLEKTGVPYWAVNEHWKMQLTSSTPLKISGYAF